MKTILSLICLVCLSTLPVQARGKKASTLLVVPTRQDMVQLSRDLQAFRTFYLVAYDQSAPADEPVLHAWTGERWVYISSSRFSNGNLLKSPPTRTVIIGEDNERTAELIDRAAVWSPEVLNLDSTDMTNLINAIGRMSNFKKKDWEWFALRYDLQVQNLNQEVNQESWYDTTRREDIPKAGNPIKAMEGRKSTQQESIPPSSLQPLEDDVLEFDVNPKIKFPENPPAASSSSRVPAASAGSTEGFSFDAP